MAEAEAGKRGQGADREVADDRQEFLVAEDPLWAAFFVGSYRLAQQGGAGGVGEPLLESGHAAESGRRGGGGGVRGGGGAAGRGRRRRRQARTRRPPAPSRPGSSTSRRGHER